MINSLKNNQKGQVLVLILLVMLIGLTVGLSITSRTLQDLRSTSVTDQSSRAFTAAEAGVEEALRSGDVFSGSGGPTPVPLGNNSSYEFATVPAGGGTAPFVFPDKVARDDTQQVWLINHDTNGALLEVPYYTPSSSTLDVCWGDTVADAPAIEISVIYKDLSEYKIWKGAYDPNISRANGFDKTVSLSGCGVANSGIYKVTIPMQSGTNEAVRMRLLYNTNAATLAVAPKDGAALPPQGKIISSTGKTTEGITRKVEVFRSYPAMPAIFDFVLFSANTSMPLSK